MDPSSHSVYLADGPWYAYDTRSVLGSSQCAGVSLGQVRMYTNSPCVNLDTGLPEGRINCLQY